jgi:glucuronoarabinoxylan endo-1,4-beta-xylanase
MPARRKLTWRAKVAPVAQTFTPSANFVANVASVERTMDGFGVSDRNANTITTGTADLLFDVSSGIGLSLLRCSFDVNGYNIDSDPQNAVKAAARGAKVWAAPWSPPAAWKDSDSINGGGHLFSARYSDWGDAFVSFYNLMSGTYSISLLGMSAQNEPDQAGQGYPQTEYTTAEMVAFIKVLGPKLAALSPRPKLIAPEPGNWDQFATYLDPILADGTAASYLDIAAVHDYTYTTTTHADISQPVWQTEVSTINDTPDTSISNGLMVAGWIHRAITTGKCSAWHYWEIDNLSDNEGLIISGALTKRLFALGNWSKFVRPGWQKISVTGAGVGGVSVTAFKHPSSGAFAIVLINSNGSPTSCSVGLAGPGCTSVAPYVTSGTTTGAIGTDGNLSLGSSAGSLSTSLAMTGNALTLTLPVGVTTLVGGAP